MSSAFMGRPPRRSPRQIVSKFIESSLVSLETGSRVPKTLIIQLKSYEHLAKEMGWTDIEKRISKATEKQYNEIKNERT